MVMDGVEDMPALAAVGRLDGDPVYELEGVDDGNSDDEAIRPSVVGDVVIDGELVAATITLVGAMLGALLKGGALLESAVGELLKSAVGA